MELFIARQKDNSLWVYDRKPKFTKNHWTPDYLTQYGQVKNETINRQFATLSADKGFIKIELDIEEYNIELKLR